MTTEFLTGYVCDGRSIGTNGDPTNAEGQASRPPAGLLRVGSDFTDPTRDDRARRDLVPFLAGHAAVPQQRPVRTACVYFVECGEYVKIGTTTQGAHVRFTSMQLPPNARVVAVIDGWGAHEEARLHSMFWRQRAGGEWFHRCPELDALIVAHAV